MRYSIFIGTSPPVVFPPSPTCKASELLCGRYHCFTPSTHACLSFIDGSGGTVCPVGDSFCGGKWLSPSSGKVCVQKPGEPEGSAYEEICNFGEQLCRIGYCYSPSTQDCVDGNFICAKGQLYCGRECYTPSDSVERIEGIIYSFLICSFAAWFYWRFTLLCALLAPRTQIWRITELTITFVIHKVLMIIKAKVPMTSREWYWKKFKSLAAERIWRAPLCLMTYSDQNAALSTGVSGWSRKMVDSPLALSENLFRKKLAQLNNTFLTS